LDNLQTSRTFTVTVNPISDPPTLNPISDITIDEEFRDLIPPLSEEEKKRLEDSLASCGMLSPLIVWKHEGQVILVDGHNRLELWKKRGGFDESFDFLTTELPFADRDDAKEWIIKNQLGRRNLSPEDYGILVGLLYNARKKAKNDGGKGTPRGTVNQNDGRLSTAEQIANETNTSPATVERRGKEVKQAEELRQQEPQLSLPEAVRKVRGKKKSTPKPPTPKPELTPEQKQEAHEKLLEKRWGKFIKDIPVTDHPTVREWITQKLKQSAL
jgi:hypothetical protein